MLKRKEPIFVELFWFTCYPGKNIDSYIEPLASLLLNALKCYPTNGIQGTLDSLRALLGYSDIKQAL